MPVCDLSEVQIGLRCFLCELRSFGCVISQIFCLLTQFSVRKPVLGRKRALDRCPKVAQNHFRMQYLEIWLKFLWCFCTKWGELKSDFQTSTFKVVLGHFRALERARFRPKTTLKIEIWKSDFNSPHLVQKHHRNFGQISKYCILKWFWATFGHFRPVFDL